MSEQPVSPSIQAKRNKRLALIHVAIVLGVLTFFVLNTVYNK